MKAFHIVHWDNLYETAETRRIRTLTYYSKSNKLVGEGIGLTLNQANGLQLYGTWTLLEALASTAPQEHRGWLVRNGSALTAARMAALRPPVTEQQFQAALTFFSRPDVGWLEFAEWATALPGRCAGGDGDSANHPEGIRALPGRCAGGDGDSANHPEGIRALPGRCAGGDGDSANHPEGIRALPGRCAGGDGDSANHPEGIRALPGRCAGGDGDSANHPEGIRAFSLRGKTDRRGKTEVTKREREEGNGFASTSDGQAAQRVQFGALQGRLRELKVIPEDELTEEQAAEFKKTARRLKALQKKQAAGDFTPLGADE